MFKVTVRLAFGTGGWIGNPHKYWAGTGVAICRSPKAARRIAYAAALRKCGEGANWIPVHKSVEVTNVSR